MNLKKIDLEEAIVIHDAILSQSGGGTGVRDEEALASALARPFGGFGDTEFYPSPIEKAAALVESIIMNHPFVDGNKRTAYVLCRMVLLFGGLDLEATKMERYNFVVDVSTGKLRYNEILTWLQTQTLQ